MALLTNDYVFPQKSTALNTSERGVASISHRGRTFRFRTNPNEFRWNYTLKKRVDQTYGGRVIQLLGTSIDDFVLKADAGGGRWDYVNRVSKFLRDVMVDQRNNEPATFEYTTRGWKFNCYIVSIPFQDAVEEVLREFEIQLKVQEDVSGLLTKNSLETELRRLSDGIGFRRSKYNDPKANPEGGLFDVVGDALGALPIGDLAGIVTPQTVSQFLPNGLPGIGSALSGIGRN